MNGTTGLLPAMLIAFTLSLGLAACEKRDGTAENIGEKIDEAADDAKEKAEDIKDKVKDGN